ncbi:MAG TPA: PilZ domain-containing protein [Longimicrobium sp.]|nr:PilZ domain-containing protein [Longimicrobium sp.]
MSVSGAPAASRRTFIRHTVGVPIVVRKVDGSGAREEQSVNVSEGGLSFVSENEIPIGTTIEVCIAEVDPPFQAEARVVWASPEPEGGWCTGVQFLEAADAFRVRMVEQVCAIERYRREVEAVDGRLLTPQEAAKEWIGKYAGRFPGK